MIVLTPKTFKTVLAVLAMRLGKAPLVEQERWQGKEVQNDPAARVYELQNVVLEVPLEGKEDLGHWQKEIDPSLPWADNHFLERVGGEPLNPGVEWQNWPWGQSASRFRNKEKLFNHTYMERLWPRYARMTEGGRFPKDSQDRLKPHQGIGFSYGDLQSLVDYLIREPSTRQAWIPLFFPEDTGYGDGGRKPCTLGYQFLVRRRQLHIWYPLRSCDFAHHVRDDCYLAIRLLLWVLQECRKVDSYWDGITPGSYAMHITSLHIFENDRNQLK